MCTRIGMIASIVSAMLLGCQSMHKQQSADSKETPVSREQLSQAARATLDRELGNGQIEKIDREIERGRTVYDVEANVDGRHVEFLISESNGELLGTEVPMEFAQLPVAVQSVAEKHFGMTAGLKAMKCIEYGNTHYEIEGMRDGKRAEASFNVDGTPEK